MSPARYLVDTSALVRLLRNPEVRGDWQLQITSGLVAVCELTELELLHTARSKAERDRLIDLLRAAYVWAPMPERVFERAADVQSALTAQGKHRCAGAVDLLTAATAELHQLALLHYDRDFEQVGHITGQRTQWLVPPGSVD